MIMKTFEITIEPGCDKAEHVALTFLSGPALPGLEQLLATLHARVD